MTPKFCGILVCRETCLDYPDSCPQCKKAEYITLCDEEDYTIIKETHK